MFCCVGAPPRPSGFNVTERTPSSITVQWDPPSLDGVTHELSYHIDNSNNESWDRETVESGATSYRLENLRSNTSYVLRLTALRNSIRSLPTSQLIVRTRISGSNQTLNYCCCVVAILRIVYVEINELISMKFVHIFIKLNRKK